MSRRCLNGLNQIDALKNAAAATMLQKSPTESTTKRSWKQPADPNLLLEILHGIHQTGEHMAQLLGHLFSTALMDRRTAALNESVATQEIKKTLLLSPPFSKGLFDEEHMKTAKKELDSDVVRCSLMRPAVPHYKKSPHPFPHRQWEITGSKQAQIIPTTRQLLGPVRRQTTQTGHS